MCDSKMLEEAVEIARRNPLYCDASSHHGEGNGVSWVDVANPINEGGGGIVCERNNSSISPCLRKEDEHTVSGSARTVGKDEKTKNIGAIVGGVAVNSHRMYHDICYALVGIKLLMSRGDATFCLCNPNTPAAAASWWNRQRAFLTSKSAPSWVVTRMVGTYPDGG